MKEHDLKSETDYFSDLWLGRRHFEVRRNDRDYAVCDHLLFREYNRQAGTFTGREERRVVTFVLLADERLGLAPGFCVLGLGAEGLT